MLKYHFKYYPDEKGTEPSQNEYTHLNMFKLDLVSSVCRKRFPQTLKIPLNFFTSWLEKNMNRTKTDRHIHELIGLIFS